MTALALYGGEPITTQNIPYTRHTITASDKEAVTRFLDSGDAISGRSAKVWEFEDAIAEYTGYKHALAVSSATMGLYVAYKIGLGEFAKFPPVRIPALTFVATANMAIAHGYHYSIVDVDPKTLTYPFPSDVNVSYAGYPIEEAIVADDAHSLTRNMGQQNNTISVISTHAAKTLTTGEGGIILTNDDVLCTEMAAFIDHGRGDGTRFGFGYNFRMSGLNAALGLSQLERVDNSRNYRKNEIAKNYFSELGKYPEIILPADHENHSYHLFVIRLDGVNRCWFRAALLAEGIETQVHYKPLYEYQHISPASPCPVSQNVWECGLSIPMFSGMSTRDRKNVVDSIHKIMEHHYETKS